MKKILQFFKNKFFAAICSGALCNLSFAPLHFFPAAIISISVFYLMCEKSVSRKETFWLGWCFGFGYFVAGVYWISISLLVDAQSFAWLIPFAITLIPSVLALYFGLLSLSFGFLIKKFSISQNYQKIIIFAICWIITEVLRAFLFTGFPWNLLGYSLMFSEYAIQSASIFGVWGLSLFVVLIAVIPALFWRFDNFKIVKISATFGDKIFAVILICLFMANFIFGMLRVGNTDISDDRNLKLRLIQGNIKQEMKWNPEEKYRNLVKHIKMSDRQNSGDVAAVIWSETSVPYAIDSTSEIIDQLKIAVPQTIDSQGVLITGGLRFEMRDNGDVAAVWNSVFGIDNNGIIAAYDKHHLVPFGEYVPLQKYLSFVQKITDGAIGFSEGKGPKTIHTKLFSFSPLLCYEVIFPDKIIDRDDRPDLLVNLTNDAWFGNSSGPYQHFDMAKMRAVEYGIPLVRVANTGITVFFDPWGREIDKINLNQEGQIDVKFIKNLEPTLYSSYCFAPLFLLVSFLIIFLATKNVIRQNYTS